MTQIMIVDDSPTDTHLLKKILEKNGLKTFTKKVRKKYLILLKTQRRLSNHKSQDYFKKWAIKINRPLF